MRIIMKFSYFPMFLPIVLLLAVVVAAVIKLTASQTAVAADNRYVSVTVDGVQDGENIELLCLTADGETRADFSRRVEEAGDYLRADIKKLTGTTVHSVQNAALTSESKTDEAQLSTITSEPTSEMDDLLKKLSTLYNCKLAPEHS